MAGDLLYLYADYVRRRVLASWMPSRKVLLFVISTINRRRQAGPSAAVHASTPDHVRLTLRASLAAGTD
jgi:hypothetical protein